MGSQALHSRVRTVLLMACILALAGVPAALAQEPPVTVPVTPDPAPSPDPVPDDPEPEPPSQPPASSGGDTSPPSPAVSAPPEPSGPTAAELREQREAERERRERERERQEQREQREAVRERKRLLALRAQIEEIWTSGVIAFGGAADAPAAEPVAATEPDTVEAPPSAAVQTIEPEPAAQASPPAALQPAGSSSSLAGAAPVLLGLLGLAVLLLGVAALPPWTVRSAAVAGLLATRRLEIGLIGAAVLASAAIGLVIAIVAGG